MSCKDRERILKTRPWIYSTGPRTQDGKSRVAHNAVKHGLCSAEFFLLLKWAASVEAAAEALTSEKDY